MMNMNRNTIAASYEDAVQAIQSASPGDTIILKNGIWSDIQLDFKGKGTADRPITLKAETPGEAVLTGASTLTISGEHLVVEGLYFKDGIQPGKDGVSTIIRFLPESRYCRLTCCAIVDYHAADKEKKYFWVTIDGSHHRVDHCYFKGKDYAGQLLRNIKYSSCNRIDHNYFVDIPPYGINGLEIIQVMGIGSDGELGSAGGEHVIIEHNLFERADGECEEVISVKSNHDVIRNNTFKESIGGVVIRSGHNTVVEANYFIGGNVAGTKGVRICGEDNVVTGNYMTGLQGFSLSVMAGEYIEKALTPDWQPVLREGTPLGRVPMYNPSKRNIVAGNVFIHNEGVDLDIGIGYKSGWPSKQRVLLPEHNELSDNVIVKERGPVITVAQQDPSVMDVAFAPNRYVNNMVCAKDEDAPKLPEGLELAELSLEVNEHGLPLPVMDGAKAAVLPPGGPLTADNVGPEWVKRKRLEGEPEFQPRDQFATAETVPWDPQMSIWVLCVGSSDMFVRSMRTKIDAGVRELCPVEKDGTILLPVRAAAEKLGFKVTDGREFTAGSAPVIIDGSLFLPAEQLADALGKSLLRDERGLIIMTEQASDMARFEDKSVMDRTFELFKVTASRFEKYMTIPPAGRSHGRVPANTLNADPSAYWSSYGDGEWIRYDLGAIRYVGSVGIAFAYIDGEASPYAFDIETSLNGRDWTKVFSGSSSSGPMMAQMETFSVAPVSARFVRITGHMTTVSNANRYSAVQVFSPAGEGLL